MSHTELNELYKHVPKNQKKDEEDYSQFIYRTKFGGYNYTNLNVVVVMKGYAKRGADNDS